MCALDLTISIVVVSFCFKWQICWEIINDLTMSVFLLVKEVLYSKCNIVFYYLLQKKIILVGCRSSRHLKETV